MSAHLDLLNTVVQKVYDTMIHKKSVQDETLFVKNLDNGRSEAKADSLRIIELFIGVAEGSMINLSGYVD